MAETLMTISDLMWIPIGVCLGFVLGMSRFYIDKYWPEQKKAKLLVIAEVTFTVAVAVAVHLIMTYGIKW